MARITVEDCLGNVANRFELVLLASRRARQIADGAEPLVDEDRDKPTVVALREIAEGLITTDILDAQEKEREARELAEVQQETENADLIAEEIKQMLSQSDVFGSDEEDSDVMGFQPADLSSEAPTTNASNSMIQDDEELLG